MNKLVVERGRVEVKRCCDDQWTGWMGVWNESCCRSGSGSRYRKKMYGIYYDHDEKRESWAGWVWGVMGGGGECTEKSK